MKFPSRLAFSHSNYELKVTGNNIATGNGLWYNALNCNAKSFKVIFWYRGQYIVLANNRDLAENKLILLYIMDKLNMPVSNLQITELIMENKLMNYFMLQQVLNELLNDNLIICCTVDSKTCYSITPNGQQLLSYFPHLIPAGIKASIDKATLSFLKKAKVETLVTSNYEPAGDNDYTVICRIKEGNFYLVDLKLTVGSREAAIAICENWEKNTQLIYSEIIDSLLKKRESST